MTASVGFTATLPEQMSDEQFEKIRKWAQDTCVKSDFRMVGNCVELMCIRKEARSMRNYQSLMNTNLQNWGCDMPKKQSGWI